MTEGEAYQCAVCGIPLTEADAAVIRQDQEVIKSMLDQGYSPLEVIVQLTSRS